MKQTMDTVRPSRILVVDDTTANLQLLTNLLTEHGYTVYPASDGELALEFVRTTLPDLILLDIRMPEMDGFEVCRRLKAEERSRAVPVIFISILEDERDKVLGFRAGAVDYITKPFQPEEVLARIQTHLRLRELTERLEQQVGERTAELTLANQQLQQEITERRRAEQQIILLHFALDHVREAAYLIDETSRFRYVNAEACRVLGYNRPELLACGVGEVDPDWPRERWPDHWRDLKAHGSLTFEGRHQTKDGHIFPVEVNANYFEYDGQGFNLALVRDITERTQVEAALAASEREFRTLAENSPDNIARYDGNCRTVYINPSLERTLGRPATELLGTTPMEVICIAEFRAYQERIAGVLATGEEAEMDIVMPDRGEGERYHNIRFVAERGPDGVITGVLAIGRDVTERKQVEDELRRLKNGLEERVKERTAELEKNNAELERLNRLFVGRELRMVELKKKLRLLAEKGGHPPAAAGGWETSGVDV